MAEATIQDWLVAHATATANRQRSQVDAAKLVATFATGIAATLTGTALQVGAPSTLDVIASSILGLSVAVTILVILIDRLCEPDTRATMELALFKGWSNAQLLQELQVLTLACSAFNEQVVRAARCLAAAVVFGAAGAAIVAAVSLLARS